MTNRYKGILFYFKKIKDNDLYIKILASNDQINSGIVYGGNSSKKKLIYQNGYFIDFLFIKKNDHSPPIITADLSKPYIGEIFNDKYKMNALLSILDLINISFFEGQYIKNFYQSVYHLVDKIIYQKHWLVHYCIWLFDLMQLLGYQIDHKKNIENKYFSISNQVFYKENDINTIEFPHNLFSKNPEVNLKNINLIFSIFENILLTNHLDNVKYKMPITYINFKEMIIKRLKF